MLLLVCAANRELTPLRSRYDSCASSALSSCLSTASSTHSVRSASPQRRRHTATIGRYHPSSSVTASPYEYDMTATSSESVERSSRTSAARQGMMTSLADSVASDEVSSCRFSGRGSVSRFLAARCRDSIDSGLTLDSAPYHADFRRASDPLLNNCGTTDTPSTTQRCHSSASSPGSAAVWRGHRVGGSVGGTGGSRGAAASLMSSRSSIATNMSDDVDVKYTPPTSGPSVVDQVVGDLLIPDEVRDFINSTYGGQPVTSAAVSLTADSTVADSPAAPVDSTSGVDEPVRKLAETKPTALTSCMYEGQAGGNSTQPGGNSTQPQQLSGAVTAAVGDIHNAVAALPASTVPPRPFDVPTTDSSTSYFRSPQPYQNSHEVQVSQVSQSWRAESSGAPRNYASGYRSGGTLDLSADDLAVRHRRNPHQMNWWTRMYGYHGSTPGNYRPNYSLPPPSLHPPRTAASFVPSQTSPSCNQVLSLLLFADRIIIVWAQIFKKFPRKILGRFHILGES